MPFIRLSDNYNDHPKIACLSDGAFRLWHQGIGFCRKYQTDGLIPTISLRQLKAYSPKRMRELMTPWKEGENPLWHPVTGIGVTVHDYLQWNPSKDEENERRAESKERMRVLRERRVTKGVAPPFACNTTRTTHKVLGEERIGTGLPGKGSGENPTTADLERAGRLREELYPTWYAKWRHGAKLRLIASPMEFQDALSLVQTWDDARLEKLAQIILTTDDEWVSRTDRSFKIFAVRATWADDRLRELEHAAQVSA